MIDFNLIEDFHRELYMLTATLQNVDESPLTGEIRTQTRTIKSGLTISIKNNLKLAASEIERLRKLAESTAKTEAKTEKKPAAQAK